tara:strand:- start:664 stop:804 length:141 start_codon:yes stop_codon:yes gene_type:complete
MNEESAKRKILNLLDNSAEMANSWVSISDRHAFVNYLLNKLELESE